MLDATKDRIGGFVAVASAMGGCVGEMWALKAYQAFQGGSNPQGACCV